MANERVLVTGCAGFIGSHLLRRLLQEGVEVVGVDDFSTGKRENIRDLEGQFLFFEGSLCDPHLCEEACKGVRYILHQASIPSVPRSIENPLASLHSSITSTVTLLLAAKKAGVQRVVQAGSSSVYGDTKRLPKTEDMTPHPQSPYAVAKLAQEYYATVMSLCYGLDTVTLRYFNVFGPRQDPKSEYAAVIPKFISWMLAGRPPRIYGDGLQTRDFTYIDNVVEGNLLAMRTSQPLHGEVINLACGNRISLLDLVAMLNRILGTNLEPLYEAPRRGDVRHSQAGVEKAKRLLGFSPIVDVEEGLRRTVEWFQATSSPLSP